MTVHFLEPLGYTNDPADLIGGQWSNETSIGLGTMPERGTPCFQWNDDDDWVESAGFAALTTFYVGFWIYAAGWTAEKMGIAAFADAGHSDGETAGYLGIKAAGQLAYFADTADPRQAATATLDNVTLSPDTLYHVGVEVVLSATVGEVHFYINGVLEQSHTGLDTIRNASQVQRIRLGDSYNQAGYSRAPSNTMYIGELYIADTVPAGAPSVSYLAANADGDVTDWTPLSGTDNSAMVDETDPDEDTTYNETSTATDRDELALQDTSEDGTFLGVQPIIRAKKTGGEGNLIKTGVRSGTSESLDASGHSIGSGYGYHYGDIVEVDPATSSAWTQAGVDGAEVVYELQS